MSKRFLVYFTIIIAIIGFGIAILIVQNKLDKTKPLQNLTISTMPFSFSGYTIFVADQKGFFKNQGLNVKLEISYSNGKQTLNAMEKGDVDMAVSSETPFIHAVMKGNEIYTVATMITAQNHLGIVGRRDSGINDPKDLANKKIGVTVGSNGEYFLDLVLGLHGVVKKSIEVINLKPNQMVTALIDGDVDAIATWNPQKIIAIKKMGNKGVVFYAKGVYSPYFIVSSQKEFVHENPDLIQSFVNALHDASLFILSNPVESREIVSHYLKTDSNVLDEMVATYSFNTTLEQSFILTLEDQTKWANDRNKKQFFKPPNYLEYIYTDALNEVAPENVTIIK